MGLDKFGTNVNKKARPRRPSVAGNVPELVDPSERPETRVVVSGASQYTVDKDRGLYFFTGETTGHLPAGVYSTTIIDGRVALRAQPVVTDELIDFPGSVASQIVEEINGFWGLGDRYKRLGFLHRRGYMFYGPQGTGKSSTVFQIVHNIVKQGDLAFYCDRGAMLISALSLVRSVEPNRPIVVIMEDIETLLQSNEEVLLQYLDGVHQIDRVINLATTNYPEDLDPRIVARPRRFDRLVEIDQLPVQVRRDYLTKKLAEFHAPNLPDQGEIEILVQATENFPFAALGELVLAIKCHDTPCDVAISRLREMLEARPHLRRYREMGFPGVSRRNGD
jgi:hypothetical protein